MPSLAPPNAGRPGRGHSEDAPVGGPRHRYFVPIGWGTPVHPGVRRHGIVVPSWRRRPGNASVANAYSGESRRGIVYVLATEGRRKRGSDDAELLGGGTSLQPVGNV